MEKNRIRSVTNGKAMRMSYQRQKEVLEMPNLIEVQKDSYQWFLDEGLNEVFEDISPIADYSGKLSLEFVGFTLCEDEKRSLRLVKGAGSFYAADYSEWFVTLDLKKSNSSAISARIGGFTTYTLQCSANSRLWQSAIYKSNKIVLLQAGLPIHFCWICAWLNCYEKK